MLATSAAQLSTQRLRVLERLEHGEAYGLDFINAGVLSGATCYVHLASMENDDLIIGSTEGDAEILAASLAGAALPRRRYTITDRGRAALVEARLPKARQV